MNIPDSTASMFCNIIPQSKITVSRSKLFHQFKLRLWQHNSKHDINYSTIYICHPCHRPPCHGGLRPMETQNNTGNQNLKWPIRQTNVHSNILHCKNPKRYITSILTHSPAPSASSEPRDGRPLLRGPGLGLTHPWPCAAGPTVPLSMPPSRPSVV